MSEAICGVTCGEAAPDVASLRATALPLLRPGPAFSVAAQLGVKSNLARREYLGHRQVVAQVRRSQRALRGADARHGHVQRFSDYAPLGERTVKRGFLRDDCFAD